MLLAVSGFLIWIPILIRLLKMGIRISGLWVRTVTEVLSDLILISRGKYFKVAFFITKG